MGTVLKLEDILPAIKQLPAADKLHLLRLLAEDLDGASETLLEAGKTYTLFTPYDTYGVGSQLMQAFNKAPDQIGILE